MLVFDSTDHPQFLTLGCHYTNPKEGYRQTVGVIVVLMLDPFVSVASLSNRGSTVNHLFLVLDPSEPHPSIALKSMAIGAGCILISIMISETLLPFLD